MLSIYKNNTINLKCENAMILFEGLYEEFIKIMKRYFRIICGNSLKKLF